MTDQLKKENPELLAREIVEECGDCDVCRDLMEGVCFFFPELYKIWDRARDGGVEPTSDELKKLLENCHFCALCPCEPVRRKIIRAKTMFAQRDGLPLTTRLFENVELLWEILSKAPWLTKLLVPRVKKFLGIHESRNIPVFPRESFDSWAKSQGLTEPVRGVQERRVAYFVGCTARFIFPQVPRAFVNLMQKLGASVYVFDQHCCGMPALLEGDRERVISWVEDQINRWVELIDDGYDLVCSCPTCSFMIRKVIPSGIARKELQSDHEGAVYVHPGLYGESPVGEDYFTDIDPLKRIKVASSTYDAGEYIGQVLRGKKTNPDLSNASLYENYIYFAPCHQREQKGGEHYIKLFTELGIEGILTFKDSFACCGLGGIRGFSINYHDESVAIGKKLMDRIAALKPRGIITECLSCRIQFEQLSDYDVLHPLEILDKVVSP